MKKRKNREQTTQGRWKRLLNWLYALPVAPLAWLATRWAAGHSAQVEKYYSTGIYPVLAQVWGFPFRFVPFSAAEVLLYAGILALAAWLVTEAVLLIARPDRLYRAARVLVSLAVAASLLYGAFVGLWSLNYYRQPLAVTLELDTRPSSTRELAALCEALIARANSQRTGLPEDDGGVVKPEKTLSQILKEVPALYSRLGETIPCLAGTYSAPKPVILSQRMCYTQTVGIYIPFTVEANINVAIPWPLLASTAAHEAAHQRGFAREDEANFLAYLACNESDDPYIRYSGTLLALIHAMNALYSADADAYHALRATYASGIDRDQAARTAFWQKYKGPVAETSNRINDNYLKANDQADGVRSYGRMVDLLLALHRTRGLPD